MLLVSLRWLGAVLLLVLFARRAIARDWEKIRPHIPRLFLMGTLGFTVFNAFFYVAAYTTTALNIGIIQGSIPVLVLLGALLLYKIPISRLQGVGVFLTVSGVCVVASQGDLYRLASLTISQGDLFMVIACLLYSGYALGLRRFAAISPISLFTVIAVAALLSSLPISYGEYLLGNLQWPTTKGWIIALLVTFLPSFLAQICFIQGVADIGPGRAGIFVNLVPVFAAILAVSILGEPFRLFHFVALVLVISGIWMAERRRQAVQAPSVRTS